MSTFKIAHLDHIGVRVSDLETSIAWYERTLGLKKYQFPKWGKVPTFMLAGKTGIALFPPATKGVDAIATDLKIVIDHLAFNVSPEDFELARQRYDELGLDYVLKDHSYFLSIYTDDPDGHVVELTTMTKEGASYFADLST